MRKLEGTLIQGVADATLSITRDTGALQARFQAVKPRYLRFYLASGAIGWAGLTSRLAVIGTGVQSGLRIIWATTTVGTDMNNVFEWSPPLDQPLLFDEAFKIDVTSVTGVSNTIEYVLYYDIVTSDELTMVQTIDGY